MALKLHLLFSRLLCKKRKNSHAGLFKTDVFSNQFNFMFVNGCDIRSFVKKFFFRKGFNSKEREAIKPRKKKRNKKKKAKN